MKLNFHCRLEQVDATSRDKAVHKILEDPEASSSRLWPQLQKQAFVPTAAGVLKKVTDLYAPDKSLQELLEGEDCFPADSYVSNKKVIFKLEFKG